MTEKKRTESDFLGTREISDDILYGIHTVRANENFHIASRPVHPQLISAYGSVKLACLQTNQRLAPWSDEHFRAMEQACQELIENRLDTHFPVDALQGGAGTSLNLNVNEVLTNRTLQILGRSIGDYTSIDPLRDFNKHQSTNDTFPTALRVAAIQLLRKLQENVVTLQEAFQKKEREFDQIVKVGRTQLQDAVLTTVGREMSAYAEAFSRDRWRLYKCEERLRMINLGGTAIGTGLGAPTKYIFRVTDTLRSLTGIGLARSENLVDATQNTDVFVEVSGILKTLAANLIKIANDFRLLASGPRNGFNELQLPARQTGSSIMPHKVNPVIPEAVIQAAIQSISCDNAITTASHMGNLELNAFMPLIADSLLNQIQLLNNAAHTFFKYCVKDISFNQQTCTAQLESSTAMITSLVESLGYERAESIINEAETTHQNIREVVLQKGLLTEDDFDELISAEQVTRLGSR